MDPMGILYRHDMSHVLILFQLILYYPPRAELQSPATRSRARTCGSPTSAASYEQRWPYNNRLFDTPLKTNMTLENP